MGFYCRKLMNLGQQRLKYTVVSGETFGNFEAALSNK